MQNLNRDLLVVTKKSNVNQQELETTILALHHVLYNFENVAAISKVTEVLDLNAYHLYKTQQKVSYYLNTKASKKFVFFINKN